MVKLGDGWWRGGNGVSGVRNLYGTKLALLCQLEIDGECVLAVAVQCTDEDVVVLQKTLDDMVAEITDYAAE